MSTVEERFETVIKNAKAVMEMAEDLGELGLYGREEQSALTVLMVTLDKAMKVLDPAGAKAFVEQSLAEKMKMPEFNLEELKAALSGLGASGGRLETGQYL